nr:ATP-binding protein [Chryseosolibacter indicus]
MSAYVYLGRFYLELNQFNKSVFYFQRADSTGHVIKDEINIAEIKTYLAESYLNIGLLNQAEAISKEGLDVILRHNNLRMMPQAYRIIGQIYFKKNNLAEAKKYFSLSLDVSIKIKELNAQMNAYYYLWKISEHVGNERDRLTNLNQYLLLKDSVKDLDLARQVERLQFEIEIQKKEQENKLLKSEDAVHEAIIQKQKMQNNVLYIVIVSISIVGFLIWRNSKRRTEVNRKLIQQNAEIEAQRKEIIKQNSSLSLRNQQLSDLNNEKDTLMSIVAHDLKSPLHRINGIVDLMESETALSEDQKIYMKMTRDATRQGLSLITDLLDVHMIEENIEPNYITFDISTFLLEKTQNFTPAADAKNIHLYIKEVTSEEVTSDIDYLDRIVDNLLSNAIKFSGTDSTIVLAAGKKGNEFWISIKDQGQGFTERDKQQLYQKFKKLSARPTRGESSNGLGLAIVKTLVDRLKGKIELNSEQGKGSEFIVRIPSQETPAIKI